MTQQLFHQELIVENILSFTDSCDWLINVPPLISTTFYQVFSSEKFAQLYLSNALKLNDEQDMELLESMVAGSFGEYNSCQAIFREFIDRNLEPRIFVKQFYTTYELKVMKHVEEIISNTTLAYEIHEGIISDYYDCDLVIVYNGATYEITNVSQFWKGGEIKKIFIKSKKPLRDAFTHEQGGFEIEATIFMGFGYPITFTFSGDYSYFEGDAPYFSEKVEVLGTNIFDAYDSYVGGTTNEDTKEIMSNFISVEQDQIPSELDLERVFNTLCYHWFGPFFHGKSKMKDTFKEIMQGRPEYDADNPAIYSNSHMKPSLKASNKRKDSTSQSNSKSKKNKH